MIQIGMCDDESAERDNLKKLISQYFSERHIAFETFLFSNGEELLTAAENGSIFNIIFLDIFMGRTDGMTIAQKIRDFDKSCSIIFATSSRSHAVRSYSVRADHYLTKPVEMEFLIEALDRALEKSSMKNDKNVQIQNKQGSYKLALSDLIYAESNARVICVHTLSSGEIKYYDKLDNLEKLCSDERMLRCHKSFLVNLDFVHSVVNNKITMEDGTEIPVSISAVTAKETFASYTAKKI